MHDMLCKCKCKIPPSNALEITLDSWAVQFSHPPCWRQPNSLFLCEFCIILMERPRLNLRSQYWAIWPNLEASSRLGTEIMENSSWEVRPSLPSTRRGRFSRSQRQLFSFCSSRYSFEVELVIRPKEVELNPRVRYAFGNVLLFRLKNFVVNSRQG